MLLDRSLRLAVRNFSSLFLVVFIAIGPLHLIYGLLFQDVVALRELHPAIAEFPETRLVRGVGRGDIAQAEVWFWILALLELAALPLLARPIRQVLATDLRGDVPTAVGAYRRMGEPAELPAVETGVAPIVSLGAAAVLALVVGGLVRSILGRVVDLLPDSAASLGLALADATARSAGAALLLTTAVLALGSRRRVPADKTPDLY